MAELPVRNGQTLFANMAVMFTETTLLGALYSFFGTLEGEQPVQIALIPWLIWVLACLLLFYWFTGKERPVPALVALGLLLYAAGAVVILPLFSTLGSITSWIFALLMLAVSELRAAYLNFAVVRETRHVGYVECAVISTAVLLLLQAGPAKLSPIYNGCLMMAVLLNFLVAISARIVSEHNATVVLSRVQGVFAIGAAAALVVVLILVFSSFGTQSFQESLLAMLSAVGRAVLWFFAALEKLMYYLISLLPDAEPGELGMEQMPSFEMPEESAGGMADMPPWLIAALALACLLVGCLVLAFLMRHVRLKGRTSARRKRVAVKRRKPRLLSALGRWLCALAAGLRFRWRAFRYRNTPQGLLVYLERWGARHKVRRLAGETHRGYLQRLAGTGQLSSPEGRALLESLGRALDAYYYAPGGREKGACAGLFGHAQVARLRALCGGNAG